MTTPPPHRAPTARRAVDAASLYFLTLRTAVAAALNGSGTGIQVALMIVNDVTWVGFWLGFAAISGEVRGWDGSRLLILESVLLVGGGTALGFLGNARRLNETITNGGLDSILALPAAPLPQVLLRRVEVIFLTDIAFGLVLFMVVARPSIPQLLLFFLVCALSTVVMTSILLGVNSLAFVGLPARVSESATQIILLFGAYPADLFGSTLRFALYVVLPMAFVTTVPAELIVDFSWRWLSALVATAGISASIATITFQRGLRRYTSGSLWHDQVG